MKDLRQMPEAELRRVVVHEPKRRAQAWAELTEREERVRAAFRAIRKPVTPVT